MNISELFENIQDNFLPEELNGEFTLQGNCIVWTYCLDDDCEDIETINEEDDDPTFSFEAQSMEELLQEAYDEDVEAINGLLDTLEESDNWSFSEPDIIENVISFRIF